MVCKNLNSARSKLSSICRVSSGIRANPAANSGVATENRVLDRGAEDVAVEFLSGLTSLEFDVVFAVLRDPWVTVSAISPEGSSRAEGFSTARGFTPFFFNTFVRKGCGYICECFDD